MLLCSLVLASAGCDNDQPPTSVFDAGVELGDGDPPDTDDLDASAPELDATPPDSDDSEAGEPIDTGSPDDVDAGEPLPSTVGKACNQNSDCADGVYCNGDEICQQADGGTGTCAPAPFPPCSTLHRCLEAESRAASARRCDCAIKDLDDDGVNAMECGGKDCDDAHDNCLPGGTETCDDLGLDEDCNAATIDSPGGDGDKDGDGYTSRSCSNIVPETRKRRTGDDCDDHDPYVAPHNPEVCNYKDDNCNGHIDEVIEANGSFTEGGLKAKYLPDLDRDGHADKFAEVRLECDFLQPPGYVAITKASADDCNDKPVEGADIHPGSPERCDTIDNDCDGLLDAADSNLTGGFTFPRTEVACENGKWIIKSCPADTLWCDGTPNGGCETDATHLSSCRACQTSCRFSCGELGCDEIVKVAAGGDQACGLTREGRLACWGRGAQGRLGNDSMTSRSVATWVNGVEDDAREVSVGFDHSCAIVGADRKLKCWGYNDSGQAGIRDQAQTVTSAQDVPGPSNAPSIPHVAQVAAGRYHTCYVRDDGALFCFGWATRGLLANDLDGQTTTPDPSAPKSISTAGPALRAVFDPIFEELFGEPVTDAVSVAAGEEHSCVLLKDATVACWGDNRHGQLGNGQATTQPALSVQAVPGLSDVQAITAGAYHTCALSRGRVFCWGWGENARLGHATGPDDARPTMIPDLTDVASVSAGREFTCVTDTVGKVRCWGWNAYAQLGSSQPSQSIAPVTVAVTAITLVSAASGGRHVCGLSSDNRVTCWGDNAFGQLGIGSQSANIELRAIREALGEKP